MNREINEVEPDWRLFERSQPWQVVEKHHFIYN
jgi:hypothetical protein